MKCPYCGEDNISGIDECDCCGQNLSSLDGVVPTTKIEKILMEDPISKLNPREVTLIDRKSSAFDAVRTMNRNKVGCVLVTKEGEIEGILTERDILFRVLAKKKRPQEVSVEGIMTPAPMTLFEDDTLAQALNQMAVGGYRHIPILRKGKSIGIISVRDILKYLGKLFPESSR